MIVAGPQFSIVFCQAEDGIRDHCVTGVQTCALPIYWFVSPVMTPSIRNPDGSITGVDRIDGVITGETNQYYRDFARAMQDIGYGGYISYEQNGKEARREKEEISGGPVSLKKNKERER